MKYLYIIVIIFFLTSCDYQEEKEYEEYFPNNSFRFIRTEEDTSIIINKDQTYYLLLLNKQNINTEVEYLIKYKDIKTNIKTEEEYLLDKDLTINNIEFKINNKIEINLNDKNICIYIKELDKDEYSDCNFIYLYNPDKDFYITLNSDLLGLLYHSYTKFNYRFMRHLATVWIDSFTIDSPSYTTIILDNNDFTVTSDKIRVKTIHKK